MNNIILVNKETFHIVSNKVFNKSNYSTDKDFDNSLLESIVNVTN